jgi:hypothetical protein
MQVSLNISEQEFKGRNGDTVEYIRCEAILGGVSVYFEPSDRTGKEILKAVIKKEKEVKKQ